MKSVAPFVGWHEANAAILFFGPDGAPMAGFRTADLRAMGWTGTDADYRASLPRLDPSPLAVAQAIPPRRLH